MRLNSIDLYEETDDHVDEPPPSNYVTHYENAGAAQYDVLEYVPSIPRRSDSHGLDRPTRFAEEVRNPLYTMKRPAKPVIDDPEVDHYVAPVSLFKEDMWSVKADSADYRSASLPKPLKTGSPPASIVVRHERENIRLWHAINIFTLFIALVALVLVIVHISSAKNLVTNSPGSVQASTVNGLVRWQEGMAQNMTALLTEFLVLKAMGGGPVGPKGDKGDTGLQGIKGDTGAPAPVNDTIVLNSTLQKLAAKMDVYDLRFAESSNTADSWIPAPSSMENNFTFPSLHGMFGNDTSYISKTFSNLASHNCVQVSLRYWAILAWDKSDLARVYFDSQLVFDDARNLFDTTTEAFNCMYDWKTQTTPANCYKDISIIRQHNSSSIKVTVGATLNEAVANEGWGFSNFKIELFPSACPSYSLVQNDANDARWSDQKVTTDTAGVSTVGFIHGNFLGTTTLNKTFAFNRQPHCSVNIKFRYFAFDSWNPGEIGFVKVDGSQSWSLSRSDLNSCTSPWTSVARGLVPVYPSYNSVCIYDVNINVTQSADSMKLQFGSTLDSDITNESWGVANIVVTAFSC